eukprot:6585631-Prymnesium_polylepis.1
MSNLLIMRLIVPRVHSVPNQTCSAGACARHSIRYARGRVEVDSGGEVDARDGLDAFVDVRDCSVRLMRMMLAEAGQRVAERILARRGSDHVLLLREADR